MTDEPIFDDLEPERRSRRRQYHLVTDLVIGPNVRWRDNLYQAIAILICVVLGADIGALRASDQIPDAHFGNLFGACIGGFIGLVVGFLGSGIFLMMYRALAHARGRHD